MDVIFIVTTITNMSRSDQRCVGWMPTFEEAEGMLKRNAEMLHECGWYHYAVIECMEFGLYPDDVNAKWYVYNPETIDYESIDWPEEMKRAASFGMG